MPRLRTGGRPPESYQRVGLTLRNAIAIQRGILNVRRDFLAAGDVARATNAALVFDDYVVTLRRIAQKTAEVAERETIAALDASQVRPDPGTNGKRLRDRIRADLWDASPNTATGTVAMGVHQELDKTLYWRVQEYGHHFSHSPKGFFLGPGGSGMFRPSVFERRMHPIFITLRHAQSRGLKVPRGTARRIPPPVVQARHYLEAGSDKAMAYWTAEVTAALGHFTAELRRLSLGKP
jgi:hypothetical protein